MHAQCGRHVLRVTRGCTHEQCSLVEANWPAPRSLYVSRLRVRRADGEGAAPPAPLPVKVYPTRVEGDALHIEV